MASATADSGQPSRASIRALVGTISLSSLGDGIIRVSYPWLATQLGASLAEVADVVALANLPYLLLSLPAGMLADRFSKTTLIFLVNLIRAVAIIGTAVLVMEHTLTIPILFTLTFLHGCGEVLDNICVQSITRSLVPAAQLRKVNGDIYTASFALNRFVGAGIGGFLIGATRGGVLFISAALFALAPFALLMISGTVRRAAASARVSRSPRGKALFRGFTWIWNDSGSRRIVILVGVSNLIHAAATAMNVLLSTKVLGTGAQGYSAMLAAVAVGAIIGGQLGRRWTKNLSLRTLSLLDFAITGICLLGIGLIPNIYIVCLLYAVDSFFSVVWNVSVVSWRQSVAPPESLGSISGAMRWLTWGVVPVGALLGGLLASGAQPFFGTRWSVAAPIVVAGGVYFVLLLFSRGINRSLGEIPTIEPEKEVPA